MDEEELEQPSSKINLGSFFERVDSVEKVANNALSRANANLGIISNQKLIINSLSVTIEAMETKIRDIANYIIIEKKLEKDVEEDRALEEQDRLQKQAMVERATTIMGEPGPQGEPGQPAEQQGGGSSLLGTLLRLGIGAFALKFIWPAILPLTGGLLKGALAKFAAFSIGGLGTLLKGIVISTLGGLGVFGLGKVFTNLGNSIKDRFDKVAEGSKNIINKFKFGKDGSVDGSEKLEVSGEGGTEVEKENLVNGDESMRDTLSEKDLMVTPGTRIDEYGAEGGGEPSSGDLSMFNEEEGEGEKKFKVTKEKTNMTKEEKIAFYEKMIESGEKGLLRTKNARKIQFHKNNIHRGKIGLRDLGDKRYEYYQTNVSQEERIDASKAIIESGAITPGKITESATIEKTTVKPVDLSLDNIDGDMTQAIAKTNERIDNIIGGENKDQNTSNLVSANKPNVSEATLKLAAAPLPFVKVIKNNQLSTSPKSYNGLPPEIAAMIS